MKRMTNSAVRLPPRRPMFKGVLRKLIHERKSQTQQSSSALEQQSPVASQRAEANTANSSLKTVPTANNTIDDTLTSSQSTTLGHLKGEGESVSK